MRTRGLDAPRHTRFNASGGSFRTRQLGLSHGSRLGPWTYLSLLDYSASDNTFRFWDDNGTEYNNGDDEWATRRNSDFSPLRLLNKVGRTIGTYRLQMHSTLDWSHKGLPGLGNNQSLQTRFDTWRHMVEANLYGARASGHTFRLKSTIPNSATRIKICWAKWAPAFSTNTTPRKATDCAEKLAY